MPNIAITIGSTFEEAMLADISKSLHGIGASLKKAKKKTSRFAQSMEKINQGSKKIGKAFDGFKSGGKFIGKVYKALKTESEKKGGSKIVDKKQFQSVSGHVEKFQKNITGLKTSVNQLGLAFAVSLLPVMDTLLPKINQMIPVVTEFVSSLTEWVVANPEVAAGLVGLVGSLWLIGGPLRNLYQGITLVTQGLGMMDKGASKGIGEKIAGSFKRIKTIVTGLFKSIGTVMRFLFKGIKLAAIGFRVLGLAIMANPIGFIIGAIAIGAALIIANWDKVKVFMTNIWTNVKPYWESFTTWIGNIWGTITAGVIASWETVKGFFSTIWDTVTPAWKAFTDLVGGLWKMVSGLVKSVISLGKAGFKKVVGWFFGGSSDEGDSEKKKKTKKVLKQTIDKAAMDTMLGNCSTSGGACNTTVQVTAPITINAASGMDETRLADLVVQTLTTHLRRGLIANRSLDGGWKS